MAKVATNVILIWPGANAAIPTGFTRETTLDGRFPKAVADAVNPGTLGGNATHQHNATANHGHTENNHTHTITLTAGTDYAGRATGTDVWAWHTHAAHNSGAMSGGGLSSVSATYGAVSNNPPYHEVIFIKSDGSKGIPDGVIALYDNIIGALPTDWDDCDGNNGTPNLHDKYLRGAGTGNDAGSTGGSTTNIHELVHTHTVSAHSHAAVTSPNTTPSWANDGWGGNPTGRYTSLTSHNHSTSLNSTTPTLSDTINLTTAETVEPAYKKLMAIMNNTGGEDLPKEIIGIWKGNLDDIPAGWLLCDGVDGKTIDMREKHLKIGTSAQVGNTGGSNTHTHASQGHTHTSDSHTHVGVSSQHPNYHAFDNGENYHSAPGILNTSVHPVSVGTQVSTFASANTAADSANNEPLYTEIAFIKYVGVGGAAILMAHHL